MEKKLERVISKSEIYELVCKYMRGLDRLDKTIFRSVFHDDAYCDYGFIKTDPDTFATFCMDALKDHISNHHMICLLYTSPSPRDRTRSRMPSSA